MFFVSILSGWPIGNELCYRKAGHCQVFVTEAEWSRSVCYIKSKSWGAGPWNLLSGEAGGDRKMLQQGRKYVGGEVGKVMIRNKFERGPDSRCLLSGC